MNRRNFLRSIGIGALFAPAAIAHARETEGSCNANTILKSPHPWRSALDGKWYGYDGRSQQWVEILPPEAGRRLPKWPYQPKIGGTQC